MAQENATWGAPRIHGELLKLGYVVSERTVSRSLARIRPEPTKPRSQTWATFLKNHARDIVTVDMFVVPSDVRGVDGREVVLLELLECVAGKRNLVDAGHGVP
jgi:hypothetical protein